MWYVKQKDELYHHGIKGQKWGVRRFQNPDGSYTEEGRKRYVKGNDQNAYDVASSVLSGKIKITRKNNATIIEGRSKVAGTDVDLELDLTEEDGRTLLSNEKAIPYLKQVNKVLDRISKDDSQLRKAIADDNYNWINTDTTAFGNSPPTRDKFINAFEPQMINVFRYKSGPLLTVSYRDSNGLIGYAWADVDIDTNTGKIISTQLDW